MPAVVQQRQKTGIQPTERSNAKHYVQEEKGSRAECADQKRFCGDERESLVSGEKLVPAGNLLSMKSLQQLESGTI